MQSPDREPPTFRNGSLTSLSPEGVLCYLWSVIINWFALVKSGTKMGNGLRCDTPEVCFATLSELCRQVMLVDTVSATSYYTRYGEAYELLIKESGPKKATEKETARGESKQPPRSSAKSDEYCFASFGRRVFPSRPLCKNTRCKFTEKEFSASLEGMKLSKKAEEQFLATYRADATLRG